MQNAYTSKDTFKRWKRFDNRDFQLWRSARRDTQQHPRWLSGPAVWPQPQRAVQGTMHTTEKQQQGQGAPCASDCQRASRPTPANFKQMSSDVRTQKIILERLHPQISLSLKTGENRGRRRGWVFASQQDTEDGKAVSAVLKSLCLMETACRLLYLSRIASFLQFFHNISSQEVPLDPTTFSETI